MRRLVATLLACVAMAAQPAEARPQVAGAPSIGTVAPLADTLRGLAYEMAELLRERDVPRLIALYRDTTHFVHVDAGNVVPWSQLSRMMRSYLDTVTSNPIEVVGEPGVTLVDRDNAVLYVTHRFGEPADPDVHEGVWSGVLHRFADGWRIVHSHSSDRARD